MSSEITAPKGNPATLVGDAGLFTAAAFCVLVIVAVPLAVIVGPAAAWLLHRRRLDRAAIGSGVIGIGVGGVIVGGLFMLVALVARAIGPAGDSEFTVPLTLLAIAGTLFLALLVGLDIDSLRDLWPARRQHLRLDIARLIATLIVAIFTVVVSLLQAANPASEIGEAGIFGLAATAMGAATMGAALTIYPRMAQRLRPGQGSTV